MKLNKGPGTGGLSVEFYQAFWNVLDGIVIDSLNEAYDEGELAGWLKKNDKTTWYFIIFYHIFFLAEKENINKITQTVN